MATITGEPKNVTEAAGPSPMPNAQGTGIGYETLPPLAPVTNVKEQLSGEAAKYQGPGRWWDQLAEKADWALNESGPFAAALRGALQRNTTTSSKWTSEQLNDFYKEQGVTFTEAEYPEIAALRIAQRKKEVALNDYVARGGHFGIGSELLAGSVQMLDPINLGLNYVGMRALTPLVGKLGMNTFGSMFLENAVTNLAADIPTYYQLKKEFSDQTFGEMAAGSLLSAGLAAGIGSVIHAKLSKAKPEPSVVADAVNKHEAGAKIDTSAHAKFMGDERVNGEVREGSGVPKTGAPYEPVNHPSEVPFFVNRGVEGSLSEGAYGKAVYASDSAYAANNKGDFSEVRISKDAKILNVDLPMSNPDADVFKMAVEMKMDRFGVKPIEMKDGATLSDFFRRLEIEEDAGNLPKGVTAQQIVRETAKDMGYHGMADVHKVNGAPRYNKLAVFNEEILTDGKFYEQNKQLVPKPSPDDLIRQHEDFVRNVQNRELYDAEMIAELDHLKSKPEMTPEEVKTFLKQQEVRTRADLKKLLVKTEEQLDLISDTKQGDLGIGEGRTESTGAIEELHATQALYDDVMRQIDDFIDSDNFRQIVDRITDDELGRMKQMEIEGLRGTATRKPTFRRSNLPDKDTLARMSAEEYRASIQSFADDQPELFAVHYYGVQQELDLQPLPALKIGPSDRILTSDEMGKLYLAIQQSLPFVDGAPKKVIIPPEAPTPQTRKVIGGVAGEKASVNKPELEAAPKDIQQPNKTVTEDLTEEQKAQIRNHAMTDKTRALIEEKINQIDVEHEIEMKKAQAGKEFADCLAQGIT